MSSARLLRALAGQRGSAVAALFQTAQQAPCRPVSDLLAGARSFATRAASGSLTGSLQAPEAAARTGASKGRLIQRSLASAALPQPIDSESDECEDIGSRQVNGRIGFVGAGQMGEALIRGFTSSGVSSADRISASVRSAERQQRMTALGVRVFDNALEGGAEQLAANSDIIVLGVKPIYMSKILGALAPHLTERHLVVSIAAGLTVAWLEDHLPEGARVARVMPNTPCTIGQAASAYVMGSHASAEDQQAVGLLMESVGMAVCVEEHMMDAVTAVSGSGPANMFLTLEAMADGGVAAGLPRDKALALAAQTMIGAARMVFESAGDGSMTDPGVLRGRVTSPAGTTIAGLAELESSGVRGAYIRAIKAAATRSNELSQMQ